MAKKDSNTTIITPRLLLKYVEKRTNLDESLAVLTAELKYQDIRDIVDKIKENHQEMPCENPRSKSVCMVVDHWKNPKPDKDSIWLFQHVGLPIERLAAACDSNDCVIRCEQFVMEKFGIERSLIDLRTYAEAEEWRKSEGTPLYNIGRLLENTKTRKRVKFSIARFTRDAMEFEPIEQLRHELKTGCYIILAVSQDGNVADHAIVVTDITTKTVEVFDPIKGYGTTTLTYSELLKHWEPSNYYMVSITLRGRRPYIPHPVNLSDIPLDKEIEDLIPKLMENAHEVWAKARQSEKKPWQYGPERDKKNKLSPFMLPYSEMKDEDKETDRLTVVSTLKLLVKMGYRIIKGPDTGYLFRQNQRNAAGEYIANPADLESVKLPENIIVLREYVAENVHEEWSRQRMAEGWVYGDKSDDEMRINEDLVPYCELLDSEKQYDRDMAYDTLRMLYKMGYVIEKKPLGE